MPQAMLRQLQPSQHTHTHKRFDILYLYYIMPHFERKIAKVVQGNFTDDVISGGTVGEFFERKIAKVVQGKWREFYR